MTPGLGLRHEKQVTTVWALAFNQVERTSLAAIELMRLLAYCAPETIPLHLLLQPRPDLAVVHRRGSRGAAASAAGRPPGG
jgi:hypothetical protein